MLSNFFEFPKIFFVSSIYYININTVVLFVVIILQQSISSSYSKASFTDILNDFVHKTEQHSQMGISLHVNYMHTYHTISYHTIPYHILHMYIFIICTYIFWSNILDKGDMKLKLA